MADDKPCIAELYESGGLDMELVGKIAHNELDKQKGFPFSSVSANSIRALASEYIDSYTNDLGIIEAYAAELDSQLSVEDYRGGKISPEFMLGCAIGLGAASHANADIDYFCNKFSSRAVIEIEELSLPTLRSECRTADDFSLAGVNPDTKFPIGFVSVRDVVDAVDEFGSEHMKETLAPADMERVASSLAEAEQCIERYELADLHGRGMGRVVEEKAAIRCALRQAGFDIPMANVRIHIDESAHEFSHKCIENACAQGIAIANGQAEMPAGGRVCAVEIEIDGSTLGLEPTEDGLERSLDDLCDEKHAETDFVVGSKDREMRFESKETGR